MTEIPTGSNHINEDTIPKTLWSETIIDILIDALRTGRPDDQIIPVIKGIYSRQFNTSYLLKKVQKELGQQASARVYAIIKKMQTGEK
jgi:hypothetical protein